MLALDVGKKRIGLAVTDDLGLTAQGLDPLERATLRLDLERLIEQAVKRQVSLILVGLPLHMDGAESPMSARVRKFAEKLAQVTGIPVQLRDERLTSEAAEEHMRHRGLSLSRFLEEKKRGAVDRLAAVLLLEEWLREKERAD